MAIVFSESRSFPSELRSDGLGRHFGEANFLDFLMAPLNLAKGLFVDKPQAEAAAQLQAQQLQVQQTQILTEGRRQTLRTVAMVGAGMIGLLAIAIVLKPRSRKLAGYRKHRRRSRR